ncbi:NAD(P)H-hydrate epimerase [Botrimarina hoheduenensis]|uniref:NAD(P)H-hydrate epimerase n=1 Tax=Botrimarina hoheduenensis TaxID=2528000 RepID=A0A5C5VY80_9BACT|nr:NAD(P)H-hydrate epimerase [Botrimarina hoheduenensis]TWT43384.1 Bifunctional NAD(P)H-hydrate repair enzyme Nnr [Botrimarina hoheduenensis]
MLNRQQARDFDRRAIEDLGFPGMLLMENAGRACVDVMERLGIEGQVIVVCGRGNNGGDGFVIARHLAVRGHAVRVVLGARPSELRGDARLAFDLLVPCHVPLHDETGVNPALVLQELDAMDDQVAWVVDALLGSGATGAPRPPFDTFIDWMNTAGGRRLAVDLPSGLDCDTGEPTRPTFRADHTCTFVAPKAGFTNPRAQEFLGHIHVVDIGVPAPEVR